MIMRHSSNRAVPMVGVASLIGVAVFAQFLVDRLAQQILASGFPAWIPRLESVGQTVYAYSALAAVVSYLIVPILIFSLGYYYGKNRS